MATASGTAGETLAQMDARAGAASTSAPALASASVSASVIRGVAPVGGEQQRSMGAVKPSATAAETSAARAPVSGKTAATGRRTLTLSSSDHEGRPQQVVVLEASITSDATVNSSERSSLSSASDEDDDDVLNDEYGAHSLLLDEIAECDEASPRSAPGGGSDGVVADGILVKPMTKRLPVCPVDDLAVEEEKRLRRSRHQQQQQQQGGKANAAPAKRRACADTDSLPTPHSNFTLSSRGDNRSHSAGDVAPTATSSAASLGPPPAQPTTYARRNSSPGETLHRRSSSASLSSPRIATGGPAGGTLPTVTPLLRKDSMAIRRQYWSQLGFSLSRSDLEKSTGRTRVRREGMRVRLNDAKSDRDVSSFFQFIRSWYSAGDDKSDAAAVDSSDGAAAGGKPAGQRRSALSRTSASRSSSRSRASSVKRGVQFHEEAELFYIPLHSDYSKRQRECMWPTRPEFISMVERNLDEVYEEMEREYEEQLAAEERETELMQREERRQRAVEKAAAKEAALRQRREAEERAAKQAAQVAAAMTSPPLSHGSRSPPGSLSGSLVVPTLALTQTEVKLVPRARSSHEIRFKYLRHLGINS